MSNEKKIIKEMVQGNLKVNRKRNLLLVLAITLTTILFTSVLEIGFGGMQSIQETQLRLTERLKQIRSTGSSLHFSSAASSKELVVFPNSFTIFIG